MLLLTAAAGLTAVLAISGEYRPNRTWVYLFKPLTTLLILGIALLGTGAPTTYKWLIVTGLVFCLGGDVFLMLPARFFLWGLVSFLVGHLVYIAAFVGDAAFTMNAWLLPLLLFGGAVYARLHPHLGKLRGPVVVYILAILIMAWQAIGRWSLQGGRSALLAAAGATLFVLSDAALALDRFRQPFAAARVVVLTTYWAAQWCIAFSVWG